MDRRKRIVWILTIAVGLHFALLIIAAFPEGWFPGAFRNVANTYTLPVFSQNWKLYAPEPPNVDGVIQYRYRPQGQPWSDWKVFGDDERKAHYYTKLGYPQRYSTMVYNYLYLLVNDAEWYRNNGYNGEQLYAKLRENQWYLRLRYSLLQEIYHEAGLKVNGGLEIVVNYQLLDGGEAYRLFLQEYDL